MDKHWKENKNDLEKEEEVLAGNLMDSRTSQLDDVLNEKLEQAFHKPTSQFILHDIAKIASEHDPIDLAYAVIRLPPAARVVVYENLPDFNAKIIFITNTGSNTRSAIFAESMIMKSKRFWKECRQTKLSGCWMICLIGV